MGELEGNVAVVTGGGSGIGAGIVSVLAREGATVVVTDLVEERAQQVAEQAALKGARTFALQHDVSSSDSCEAVVRTTLDQFGRLDTLVNNAGTSSRCSFREMDEREWDQMIDVNLKGVYRMIRAAIEAQIEQGSGSIVNTASIAAKQAFPNFSHYSAAKFGVIALTQALAKEFAEFGVRVNAVCPGVVRTRLWDLLLEQAAEKQGISQEEAWNDLCEGDETRRCCR